VEALHLQTQPQIHRPQEQTRLMPLMRLY